MARPWLGVLVAACVACTPNRVGPTLGERPMVGSPPPVVAELPDAGSHPDATSDAAVDAGAPGSDATEPPKPNTTDYVSGPCASDSLVLSAVQRRCNCAPTEWRARNDREPLCDWDDERDAARARDSVRARIVPANDKVKRGGSVALRVRWENTGDAPVKLLFFRDYVIDVEALDAQGARVKVEVDPSCNEVATLAMASFTLVTLPPQGGLEGTATWHARHPRLVGRADLGCDTRPGSPLAKGIYTLRLRDSGGNPAGKAGEAVTATIEVE